MCAENVTLPSSLDFLGQFWLGSVFRIQWSDYKIWAIFFFSIPLLSLKDHTTKGKKNLPKHHMLLLCKTDNHLNTCEFLHLIFSSYFCSACSPDCSPVWKRRKRNNPDPSVVSKSKSHYMHMYHALERYEMILHVVIHSYYKQTFGI